MTSYIEGKVYPKLSICYLGRAEDKVTDQLIGLSESFVNDNSGLKRLSKKISFLITESFQNVIRHGFSDSLDDPTSSESDFFQINIHENRISISSSNLIETDSVKVLEDKIKGINDMSSEELKALWKFQILNFSLSSKGGAGLGIIEMARKSKLPLSTKFVPVDDKISRFYLGIEITNLEKENARIYDIDDIVKEHKDCIETGIMLSYKGNFSGKSNMFLIEMLHNNFIDENNINSRIIENVSIIIEVIQNISKHGAVLDDQCYGSFSIHKNETAHSIQTYNYLSALEYESFNLRLNRIKSMSIIDLKKERKRVLLENAIDAHGNGKLGLIEIALFSLNNFEYSFEKITETMYLFRLQLNLKNHD